MASSRFSQSRSPIRAVAAASQSAHGISIPQSRPWGDVTAAEAERSLESGQYAELHLHALACPECGSALRLQLLATQAAQHVLPSVAPTASASTREPLEQFEDSVNAFKRELITRALAENGNVMTRAAKALGLKYTTFVAMAHRLGVTKDGSGN
jgi:transcriptional regulator with GAF, ATPase, and Fis domain